MEAYTLSWENQNESLPMYRWRGPQTEIVIQSQFSPDSGCGQNSPRFETTPMSPF